MFGRYMFTAVKWTPPFALQPDNILVSFEGGRTTRHIRSPRRHDGAEQHHGQRHRFAYNYTDIHRTHEPTGFSAPDIGIKTFSYIEDYMLLSVTNGGFQIGGTERSDLQDALLQHQRRSDDRARCHEYGIEAAFWKSLTQANVRSPGQFTFDGSITGLPLADFLTGRLQSLIQADAEHARHGSMALLGLYAQDTWKMSTKTT